VDFINGTCFSLPANSIEVIGVNPPDAYGKVKLGAFLAYNATSRSSLRLKRSFPLGELAKGDSSPFIVVPSFAGDVIVQRDRSQSFRVDFYDRNANLLYSGDAEYEKQMAPIEIAASVAAIRVVNTGLGPFRGQVIFGLDI
jgi:hypothetical protein